METSNQNQMEIFTFLLNDSQNDVNCPKKNISKMLSHSNSVFKVCSLSFVPNWEVTSPT